jgi:hypothetical protein
MDGVRLWAGKVSDSFYRPVDAVHVNDAVAKGAAPSWSAGSDVPGPLPGRDASTSRVSSGGGMEGTSPVELGELTNGIIRFSPLPVR